MTELPARLPEAVRRRWQKRLGFKSRPSPADLWHDLLEGLAEPEADKGHAPVGDVPRTPKMD